MGVEASVYFVRGVNGGTGCAVGAARPLVVVFGGRGLTRKSISVFAELRHCFDLVLVQIEIGGPMGPDSLGRVQTRQLFRDMIAAVEHRLAPYRNRAMLLGGHSFGGLIAGTLALRHGVNGFRNRGVFFVNTPLTPQSFRATEQRLKVCARESAKFAEARNGYLDRRFDTEAFKCMMVTLAPFLFRHRAEGERIMKVSARSAAAFTALRMPWADVSLFAHRDDGECGTGAGFSDLLRDHLSPRYKLVFAGTGDRVHSCDAAGRDAQEIAGQFFLREEMAHFPTKGDTRFIAGKLLEMLSRETD